MSKNKLLVISLIVSCLMFFACARLQKATDLVCNPTDDQKATAAAMLAALDAAQKALGEFVPIANIVEASTVLTTIKNGGCFLISQLSGVFKTVDSGNAGVQKQAMMIVKKAAGPIVLPEYAPLRKYVR